MQGSRVAPSLRKSWSKFRPPRSDEGERDVGGPGWVRRNVLPNPSNSPTPRRMVGVVHWGSFRRIDPKQSLHDAARTSIIVRDPSTRLNILPRAFRTLRLYHSLSLCLGVWMLGNRRSLSKQTIRLFLGLWIRAGEPCTCPVTTRHTPRSRTQPPAVYLHSDYVTIRTNRGKSLNWKIFLPENWMPLPRRGSGCIS